MEDVRSRPKAQSSWTVEQILPKRLISSLLTSFLLVGGLLVWLEPVMIKLPHPEEPSDLSHHLPSNIPGEEKLEKSISPSVHRNSALKKKNSPHNQSMKSSPNTSFYTSKECHFPEFPFSAWSILSNLGFLCKRLREFRFSWVLFPPRSRFCTLEWIGFKSHKQQD